MLMDGWMTYGLSAGLANMKSSVSGQLARWHPHRYRGHLHALAQELVCLLPHSAFSRRSTHDSLLEKVFELFIGSNALMSPGRLALVIIMRDFSLRRV